VKGTLPFRMEQMETQQRNKTRNKDLNGCMVAPG
jgi:hypothetical protein